MTSGIQGGRKTGKRETGAGGKWREFKERSRRMEIVMTHQEKHGCTEGHAHKALLCFTISRQIRNYNTLIFFFFLLEKAHLLENTSVAQPHASILCCFHCALHTHTKRWWVTTLCGCVGSVLVHPHNKGCSCTLRTVTDALFSLRVWLRVCMCVCDLSCCWWWWVKGKTWVCATGVGSDWVTLSLMPVRNVESELGVVLWCLPAFT